MRLHVRRARPSSWLDAHDCRSSARSRLQLRIQVAVLRSVAYDEGESKQSLHALREGAVGDA